MKLEPPVRRLALATALVAATSALTWAGHADTVRPNKGTHRFATTDALVPVLDGPTNTHAVTIDTRLYVPDNATARTPQPAILMTHGFGLNKLSGEVTSMATFLARHGYVVLTYTSQGFGKSTGCISLQSRTYDVKDAQQLITKVLQSKPYVKKDRKGAIVGTVGGSYGGGIQANLAEADPRVRAINPYRTWSSLQYSLAPNNWVVPGDRTGFTHTLAPQGVFKRSWTTLLSASGLAQPVGGLPPTGSQNGGCPQDKLADPSRAPELGCTGFRLDVCQTLAKLEATGDADAAAKALVADSSGTTLIGRLRVPTLLVQGQSDTLFNLNDAVAVYTQLRRQRTPVQMIWNSGGHGGYDSKPGECEVYGGGHSGLDDCYLTLRTLAFLDHWLRGKPDRSPGFTYYRDWVPYSGKGATKQYGEAPAFPTGETLTLTLSGSGQLVVQHPVSSSVTLVNPPAGLPGSHSEISNFTGPGSSPNASGLPPADAPGTSASFTSGPLAQPIVSVGVPSARLRLSHVGRSDLFLFGKVYDVDPQGNATLIHRLVAPIRIPSPSLDPWVDVKLLGFAHRFDKNHQIRVTFSTTDATSYNNPQPDVITLTTGLGTSFTLPVARG
ncbi:MAG TPA: CocE/NonD family hydrolase [Mycobacteriales bacterium]|nr:CocE/NonD family hydrolase [Mycobacteriales bacterium]